MSVLSWGKCRILKCDSVNGAPSENLTLTTDLDDWTAVDTPKEDTTKLTATAGNEVTATEEGGETVDVRYNKNSFELEFDIFVKKNGTRPFPDDDGLIAGEHSILVIPEDEDCEGLQIDRAHGRVEQSYSTADGILLHYVFKALKPAAGKMVKAFIASSLTVPTP